MDALLGMQWLYSLGITEVDWKNLILTFTHQGKKVTIRGDPSLTKARVSLKSLMKSWGEEDQGFLVECRALERRESLEEEDSFDEVLTIEESVEVVLKRLEDVFEWPETLSPRRLIEHPIDLKKGTDPVNVRPYRYAYQQKTEMERLMEEMLASGVIKPSTSPYSSPVLVVRKKDGSWRFCVDYKALNNVTVLDKFPIPVIEELFDELHGATMFTKILSQDTIRLGCVQMILKRQHSGPMRVTMNLW